MRSTTLAVVLGLVMSPAAGQAASTGPRHVPSPDWADQIIYFVVTDRFDDGDSRNNDQGAGEFGRGERDKYNGGDFRGLERRIDYIRTLGATTVWITPPVANQWWDLTSQTSGYHGYWAANFTEVDRHLGTLADYQQLAGALHQAGLYLVQDIVVNHTGNFFAYDSTRDTADPARGFHLNPGSRPVTAPTQSPFDRNDARLRAHRRAGIYHWTPDLTDVTDSRQEWTYQLSGLDDLNTENPAVRRALRQSYGYWIREVGVDGFRVDTAFYVPPEFFADFRFATDRRAPGMDRVARQTGRRSFLSFGEGFALDRPFSDVQARKIERYRHGSNGTNGLPGMLNFPLYGTLTDVFARGRPTAELGDRIERMMSVHGRPHGLPTFVDNHDVDRFLAGGSVPALKQSLLAILTLPGIPTFYYGTEQGFTEPRAAMFPGGFASGGRDHFDPKAPLYRFLQAAIALRRGNPVFSRGKPTILQQNAAASGALAYRVTHEVTSALVVFNSSDRESLIDNLATGAAAHTRLEPLFGVDLPAPPATVGPDGALTLKLPARAGWVWRFTSPDESAPSVPASLTLDPGGTEVVTNDFTVSGQAWGVSNFRLVVDGDIASATTVTPDPDGRWQAQIATSRWYNPEVQHHVVAWNEAARVVSARRGFRVGRPWKLLAEVDDPAGDDRGPRQTYRYPTHPTYGDHRQMDIRRLRAFGNGGSLRLDLTMNQVTAGWRPQNGFDHVAFSIFLEIPNRPGGVTALPFQNAVVPAGMRWHLRLRAHGWSNARYSSLGAASQADGTAASPAAEIRTDLAPNTVSFILPAEALGELTSLTGVKIYATTWDYDGGYRALRPEAEAFVMGGGSESDPRVMDETPVLTLP